MAQADNCFGTEGWKSFATELQMRKQYEQSSAVEHKAENAYLLAPLEKLFKYFCLLWGYFPFYFALFSMSTLTAAFIHALLPKSRHWTKYYKTEHQKFRYFCNNQLPPAFITHAQNTSQRFSNIRLLVYRFFSVPLFSNGLWQNLVEETCHTEYEYETSISFKAATILLRGLLNLLLVYLKTLNRIVM